MTDKYEDVLESECEFFHIARIERHYLHAKEKHPYFCDRLIPENYTQDDSEALLRMLRGDIAEGKRYSSLYAFANVLDCEIAEAECAVAKGDTAAAVEECYDAIAVLLRVVDVLEGRQKLGKPEEEKGSGK